MYQILIDCHLFGEVSVRLNGHLSNQLWLATHHDGRVALVVHLGEKEGSKILSGFSFCFA